MPKRLHYIDWLRVLAVLLLFPFHTSRVFNANDPFYVKSPYLSDALNIAIGFVATWHMPLLFLLAGASSYFALAKRTPRQFAAERFARLGLPLLFGVLVLIPPQTYLGGRFNSGLTEPYWSYITGLDFLRWNIRDGGDYYGGFGVGQLWFIVFLLVLSLVALPLLLWCRSEHGRARTASLARRLAHPAWWLAPPLLLWLAEGLVDVSGKPALYYLVIFVLGFVIMADSAFAENAERLRWLALPIGISLCAAYVVTTPWRDSLPDPSLELFAVNYLGMLGTWTTLIGLLGLGRTYLDRPSRTLSYLAESSYPVYILHQTAIVVVAWFVVPLMIGGPVQWLAVLVASVAVTFALYEGVRRVGALRMLLGMRPASRGAAPTPP
jgi:peptidoglycan/LPS O-acetylase OafA/YrhL